MKVYVLILAVLFSSCSLFDGMRKRSFVYKDLGKEEILFLMVPKGYKDVRLVDSARNRVQAYTYSGGAVLYFAYGDTTQKIQAVDTTINIPKIYPVSVPYFKVLDSNNLFRRESRFGNLRFGYKNVGWEQEARFDSSINYASWQQIRKQ